MDKEELFAMASAVETEEYCMLETDFSRVVVIPDRYQVFGVEDDTNVERIKFKFPKIVGDNIDLSQHQIYVSYVFTTTENNTSFPDESTGLYHCDDVETSGDNITFSWLLSGNVFANPGFIAFKVMAKKSEGSELKTKWNTAPAFGTVLITVPDGEDIAEEYPDIINQLLTKMESVEQIATPEAMQGYVNAYLEENPVTGGMTEEQEQQLNQNTQDVTDLKSAINQKGLPEGGTTGQVLTKKSDANYDAEWQDKTVVSDEQVTNAVDKYIKSNGIQLELSNFQKEYITDSNNTEIEYRNNLYLPKDIKWEDGVRLGTDGQENSVNSQKYATTDYLETSEGIEFTENVLFYDKDKTFIEYSKIAPSNAKYYRISDQYINIKALIPFETYSLYRYYRNACGGKNVALNSGNRFSWFLMNPEKAEKNIHFYGDSNTYGYGVDRKSWAYYIAKVLKDGFSETPIAYYAFSPFVKFSGTLNTQSLPSPKLKGNLGNYMSIKTDSNSIKYGCASLTNGYNVLVDDEVKVQSTTETEGELQLDGSLHTITIKPSTDATNCIVVNPFFKITPTVKLYNYAKTGLNSGTLFNIMSNISDCDIAFVMVGTNDVNNNGYSGSNEYMFLPYLEEYGEKIIGIEPFFNSYTNGDIKLLMSVLHIREMYDKSKIQYMRFPELNGLLSYKFDELMQSDKLHYTKAGHVLIANCISSSLGIPINIDSSYDDSSLPEDVFEYINS